MTGKDALLDEENGGRTGHAVSFISVTTLLAKADDGQDHMRKRFGLRNLDTL